MYETVIFDLDGTLIDSAEGIINSFAYTFRKLGLPVPPRGEFGVFIGPPLFYSFETICGLGREGAARAVEIYREYFGENGVHQNTVYSGIENMLAELCARGKTLLLATSKYELYALQILENLGLAKYFSFIAGSLKDGGRGTKAEVISYVLQETGARKESAVMVGDRMHDTVGAREAGVDSIGVLWGYGSRAELCGGGAAHIANTPADVIKIVCGE
jgi:phosphoglycolate phosphatase